ncbi:MAG TPA: tetratricopeptide repeat protein, partial [Burkholderiaceae bacterium]|nr:tetratricopeptide repeat protein [Burkholderiaceae bacterium]
IELAAARVRVLSPAQLVERLRDRFQLLAGTRGVAARQATMRAAIDWSWELLTAWEQDALAQCAVFEGGFTLEAAEAVVDLAPFREAPPVSDVVEALVDKSLLRTWAPHDVGRYAIDEPHFGMYLAIHEYASAKLVESGPHARSASEERHGTHYARFGTGAAIDALAARGGPRQQRALALELDNLVSACRRALARSDAAVALATCRAAWSVLELKGPFPLGAVLAGQVLGIGGIDAPTRDAATVIRASAFEKCGRMREAQDLLGTALAAFRERCDAHAEGLALRQLATVMRQQGKMDEARQAIEASLAIHRAQGDRRAESLALRVLGIVHREQGRLSEAEPLYREALAYHRAAGSRRLEGIVLGNIGNLLAERGDFEGARSSFEMALAIHRELDDRQYEGLVLGNLGVLATETGWHDDARSFGEQALAIHRDVGNRAEEGIVLSNLASLENAVGRPDAARVTGEASLAIAREVGNRRWEGMVLTNLAEFSRAQGRHAEARTHLDQALVIHRAVGNRRSEGSSLGILGALLAAEGNLNEARTAFASGEALLREGGFRFELIELLCRRGHVELAAGDAFTARAVLAATEQAAAPMGSALGARLQRDIVALERALADGT